MNTLKPLLGGITLGLITVPAATADAETAKQSADLKTPAHETAVGYFGDAVREASASKSAMASQDYSSAALHAGTGLADAIVAEVYAERDGCAWVDLAVEIADAAFGSTPACGAPTSSCGACGDDSDGCGDGDGGADGGDGGGDGGGG